MPNVNLDLQLKFLTELDEALTEALARYSEDGAEKLAELTYMKKEVTRARRIISERMEAAATKVKRASRYQAENFGATAAL
ncbi:hypothetical protein [Kordiimonas pumila]|uniref:Uncharacterized protein n=1 Tax=Kordiimonas pumila TaxID=2161677 RepID=A0ABV7D0S5_9PROT|nr:hypothetical protein [Kordiimonas pumila]